MKNILSATLIALLFASCNASDGSTKKTASSTQSATQSADASAGEGSWKGSFSNGMNGNKLSFDVENGEVKNLTFQGHWRCDGKLESTTLGPEKGFAIKGKAVDGTITESGFYFELHGTFDGDKASGTLRIAFVAGGCDTYKLDWTAEQQ